MAGDGPRGKGGLDPERWREIETILDETMDLTPTERRAFLDERCDDDPELRREVEALLAADERTSGPLESPVEDHADALLSGPERAAPAAPRRLGPYEVVRRIGHGGMGVVYEARDTRLRRPVALKLLPREWGWHPTARKRFLREARAASAFDHPNICTVYDVGEADDGGELGPRIFLVMAYYQGETLREKLDRGPLPGPEAVEIAVQVARGLACAHRAGVVHRDVKPANVIVADPGETASDRVKLLDFGIAKIAGDAGLTRTGTALGTPAYMAPEAIRGEPVDARADVWSLGVMLYEMLAGERPFDGGSSETMIYAILNREPEPLGARCEGLPGEVAEVVTRALAKDPAERCPSAVELLADLDPAASTAGAPARPARRGWRRAAVAAMAAALLGTGVWSSGVLVRRWLGPSDAATTAEDSRPRPPSQRGSPGRAVAIDPESPVPWQLYRKGRELLYRSYRRDHAAQALELFQTIAQSDDRYAPAYAGMALAYVRLFQAEKDPLLLDRARESAELAVEINGDLAVARSSLGAALAAQGELEAAEEQLRKALRLDPLSAEAYLELGELFVARRRPAPAAEAFRKAVELDRRTWRGYERLALLARSRGDHADAEAAFARALELAPDNAALHKNLAVVYYEQGRLDEAAADLQRALEIEPLASTYANLGTLRFFQGRYQAARAAFEQAIELGANHYLHWGNLADSYRWTGASELARETYLRAVQLVRGRLDAAPGDRTHRGRLAVYLAKRGELAAALAEIEKLGPHDASDPSNAFRALVVYELAGRRGPALEALRTALDGGHPLDEIRREPELLELRKDPDYHRLMARVEERLDG